MARPTSQQRRRRHRQQQSRQLVLVLVLGLAAVASAFLPPVKPSSQSAAAAGRRQRTPAISPTTTTSTRLFSAASSASASSSPSPEADQAPAAAAAGTELSPDEELMEELIECAWDDLEEFSNKHYKFLIHPEFYLKLADRIYQLPTQEAQDEAADKATKVWNRLLKVLNAAEEQRASTAELLQKMVAQAAEADGQFYFPLAPERIEAVRAEVVKHLDRLDEGALATLNGWVLKVQDDEANKAMAEVLQKVLQFYAGGVLMRAKGYDRPDNKSGSLVFLRNLLNANPADWDMLLFNGLRTDGVCTAEELTEEIGAMIQGVVLTLPEASLTQRVQAEYLRELMSRVGQYTERDPRAF